jgi:hypothetical protein
MDRFFDRVMVERDLAGQPRPLESRSSPKFWACCPKRKPGQSDRALLYFSGMSIHPLVAAQYIQQMLKNNGFYAIWLTEFARDLRSARVRKIVMMAQPVF